MNGRKISWWVWVVVSSPWVIGLAWAATLVLTGDADRRFTVDAPASVAAILGGSGATALAAAAVIAWRYSGSGDHHAGSRNDQEPLDLHEILEQVVGLVTARPGLGGRHLSGPVITATASPLGQRDLIQIALHKIVLHAITTSRPGDSITIRAFDETASVVVEVSDTGVGLPAEDIPVADETGDRSRSRGAGLELALARAAAERSGAAIRVRSRVGLGTVVTVAMPAAGRGR